MILILCLYSLLLNKPPNESVTAKILSQVAQYDFHKIIVYNLALDHLRFVYLRLSDLENLRVNKNYKI